MYDKDDVVGNLNKILEIDFSNDSFLQAKFKINELIELDKNNRLSKDDINLIGQAAVAFLNAFERNDADYNDKNVAATTLDNALEKILTDCKARITVEDAIERFQKILEEAKRLCKNAENKVFDYDLNFISYLAEIDTKTIALQAAFSDFASLTSTQKNDKYSSLNRSFNRYKNRVKALKKASVEEYNLRVNGINGDIKASAELRSLFAAADLGELEAISTDNIECNTTNFYRLVDMQLIQKHYDILKANHSIDDYKIIDIGVKIYGLIVWTKEHTKKYTENLSSSDAKYLSVCTSKFRKYIENKKLEVPEAYNDQLNVLDEIAAGYAFHHVVEEEEEMDVEEIKSRVAEIEQEWQRLIYRSNLSDYLDELHEYYEQLDGTNNHDLQERILRLINNIKKLDDDYLEESTIGEIQGKITNKIDLLKGLLLPYKDKLVIFKPKVKWAINRSSHEVRKLLGILNEKIEKAKADGEINDSKYQELKSQKDELESQFEAISKEYKSKKKPLKVISNKSAHEYFKNPKHKKALLYAVGITTLALLFHPVTIPAIIIGNSAIAHCIPILKPVLLGLNSIAEKFTISKITVDAAHLAVPLIQGIAASGIGTANIVLPLIQAGWEVANKWNNSELKQRYLMKKNSVESAVNRAKMNFYYKTYELGKKVRNATRRRRRGRGPVIDNG